MNEYEQPRLRIDAEAVSRELKIRPEIYIKLVKSFAQSLDGKMRLLNQSLAEDNRDQMRMILHEIKGTSANLRLPNILEPENVMHAAVKAGAPVSQLVQHYEVLRRECQQLLEYVVRMAANDAESPPATEA